MECHIAYEATLSKYDHKDIISNEEAMHSLAVLLKRSEEVGQLNLFREHSIESLIEKAAELYLSYKAYRRWSIRNGGKTRNISTASPLLDDLLRTYITPLIHTARVHSSAHGGEPLWSPRKSLEIHTKCKSALSLDLESAFNNCTLPSIFKFFYGLSGNHDESGKCAAYLSLICTVPLDGKRVLPQGSSHSMPLFNRILYPLDLNLETRSKERGCKYTRWVDDIVLSSSEGLSKEEMLGSVGIVKDNYPVSKRKIFFQTSEKPLYLLGQVIEDGSIRKNSRTERDNNKSHPLIYEDWFGENVKSKYTPW